ncbi:hypothetical protein [Limnoglobus roseus]|uniref:Uncharacterized protein n=1 Tax=Limnoglobus roseus TaxID=2598579 RepID=A0A5C1ACK4_9BACT|nr:hypothetical protein [Limnoglobus roseus]QEL15716.1 hypothetical protein PX52LOC_02651 [Limnoglobus roseus]
MDTTPTPPTPPTPPAPEYKSAQYEFSEESNRTVAALADSMRVVATLMQLLGLAFVIFFVMQLLHTLKNRENFFPAIGLGASMLLCLAFGFWTAGAAASFRKIVETKNEDIWHLMRALRGLHHMYATLKAIIYCGIVLAIVGVVLAVMNYFRAGVE